MKEEGFKIELFSSFTAQIRVFCEYFVYLIIHSIAKVFAVERAGDAKLTRCASPLTLKSQSHSVIT